MAMEKRLIDEKRAKGLLAGDHKPKLEDEVKPEPVDDYRDGAFDDGLEFEDPEAELSDDERRYLQDEMDEMGDEDCIVVAGGGGGAVASGSGLKKRNKSPSSKGKGKGKASSSKSNGELTSLCISLHLADSPTPLQANTTLPPTRREISLLPPSSAKATAKAKAKLRPPPPLPPAAASRRARARRRRWRPLCSTRIAIEDGRRRARAWEPRRRRLRMYLFRSVLFVIT